MDRPRITSPLSGSTASSPHIQPSQSSTSHISPTFGTSSSNGAHSASQSPLTSTTVPTTNGQSQTLAPILVIMPTNIGNIPSGFTKSTTSGAPDITSVTQVSPTNSAPPAASNVFIPPGTITNILFPSSVTSLSPSSPPSSSPSSPPSSPPSTSPSSISQTVAVSPSQAPGFGPTIVASEVNAATSALSLTTQTPNDASSTSPSKSTSKSGSAVRPTVIVVSVAIVCILVAVIIVVYKRRRRRERQRRSEDSRLLQEPS